MMMRTLVGSCGVALSVMAGGGIASAAPGDEAIVNSTCTYPQVIDALNAQSPESAAKVTGSPLGASLLQGLINASPPDRQRMIDQYRGVPEVQQNLGLITKVAKTCNSF